jgi:serine/threonine protein kinase/tetratricopeptide (TPR) repeat protein
MADADATRARSTHRRQSQFAVGEVVAANYEILGEIGKGGMGVVYRARDLKLERSVALKFFPDEVVASEKDKQRFIKEARLAAALDHPNIGAIYGIESTGDGRTFIVMAFYDGQSLAQRIHLGGPMKLSEVLDTAKQMARGLAEAHSHSIIHRDIKPSNVMYTSSGLLKIVDFGLAHVSEQTATLTHGGAGTVGYMAPEQSLSRGTDERADIWAVGVVLAEMLTGQNPFQRDSVSATVLAVLNEPPASLGDTPLEVQRIVYRALSKDRLKRYQSCSELLKDLERVSAVVDETNEPRETYSSKHTKPPADLRRSREEASRSALNLRLTNSHRRTLIAVAGVAVLFIAAGTVAWLSIGGEWLRHRAGNEQNAPADIPSPAVLALLPFTPVGEDSHLNALGQGLVESVGAKLTGLAENRSFEVLPARNLREKRVTTLADARRQFGANLGLAVNLERTGDLVKVMYTLQNAQGNTTLGGNSITVPAADVFAVEDNVVEGTVSALHLKLRPEEQTALKLHGTASPEAYNYYIQARGYLVDYTKTGNLDNAIVMSREALKVDPNFGAAKASLGESYWRTYALTKNQHLTEQAKEECDSAIKLGNAGAAGHICLGLVYGGTGRYGESASEYRIAAELEPGNESAAIGLATMLERQGEVDEAEAAYQRVIDAHPQSYFAHNAMGGFYYRRSEYEKAIRMFQKVTELAPENYAGYVNLGGTYNDLGRFLEALEPLKKSIALGPSYAGYTDLGTSYLGLHKLTEAAEAYQQAVKIDPKQYVTWGNLASAQDYSGAKQQAFASYGKAIELASEELKVNPHDVDVLSDLAVYYAGIGKKEQAEKYLGQALQYGHSEKELLATAAQVYNDLGETGLALEWMSKAINAGYSARKFQDLVAFQNLVDNPQYQEIVGKAQHHQ